MTSECVEELGVFESLLEKMTTLIKVRLRFQRNGQMNAVDTVTPQRCGKGQQTKRKIKYGRRLHASIWQ